MTTDWTKVLAQIETLLGLPDDPALRTTAMSFVQAATGLPPPNDAGLGYWRTSIRLIWPNCEVEVFSASIEIYRFRLSGTDIATIPFRSGDGLPEDWVQWLDEPDRIVHLTLDHGPTGAEDP
jgi:hypothetical protein